VGVVINVAALTGGTLMGPEGNVSGHGLPVKVGRDEAFCGEYTGVG
jgi:hypothetical protein